MTAPITTEHFHQRILDLYRSHLKQLEGSGLSEAEKANPSLPGPTVPTLTNKDTSLFPCSYITNLVAYSSPWIDLCSPNPLIASISRQALNLEAAYANFCGVRSMVVPGPRQDGSGEQVARYARAIKEVFLVASRLNVIIHMPMYREPGLEEQCQTLTTELDGPSSKKADDGQEIDLFGAWDTWHTIRNVCKYSTRLSLGNHSHECTRLLASTNSHAALRIPRRLPEKELQTRWFAEPLHYFTLGPNTFQKNKAGHPSLSRQHQEMIFMFMRLKNAPWFILYDVGPTPADLAAASAVLGTRIMDYPSLAQAAQSSTLAQSLPATNANVSYMRHLKTFSIVK